jgi:hypothetical protein
MQKEKLQEILELRFSEEYDYDTAASLLIDKAARSGEELGVGDAFIEITTGDKFKSAETARLVAIKEIDEEQLAEIGYDNGFLMQAASFPCNQHILIHLIEASRKKYPDWYNPIMQILIATIRYQRLSNFRMILSNYQSTITANYDIKLILAESKLDPLLLLADGQLNTAAPIIDMFILLLNVGYYSVEESFRNYQKTIFDEKSGTFKPLEKRQIMAIIVIFHILSAREDFSPQEYRAIYNGLLVALDKTSLAKNNTFIYLFFINSKIYDYLDLTILRSLSYWKIILSCEGHLRRIYLSYQKQGLLSVWYDCTSLKTNFFLEQKWYRNRPQFSIVEPMTKLLAERLVLFFPSAMVNIILDYIQLSVFERATPELRKLTNLSVKEKNEEDEEKEEKQNQNESAELISRMRLPATQQESASSDCGYWALFNTFTKITELTPSSGFFINPLPSGEAKKESDRFSDRFTEFKDLVKRILTPEEKDLSSVNLQDIFDHAAVEESKLDKLFPGLDKRLRAWHDSTGIPAYTIISTANEAEKAGIFGGCLPGLKMQIAINFFTFAQLIARKLLHCVLIGINEHWHVQILATSYKSEGSIDFFRMDSAETNSRVLRQVNSHLLSILKNPDEYVTDIADELIAPMHGKLFRFSQTSTSSLRLGDREKEIEEACELLIKFFSAFGKLPLAQKYLPTLELARTQANALKNKFYQFVKISEQITELYLSSSLVKAM